MEEFAFWWENSSLRNFFKFTKSGDGVVCGGSDSDSGVVVWANNAPLAFFVTPNHYNYDHIIFTNFVPPSECSAYKCQNCKAKHDGVINAINALTSSVKELTSKRGVILSKRILYSYTSLEIERAKRRRKEIFKELSSIKKSKIETHLALSYTFEKCTKAIGEQHKLNKAYDLCQQQLKVPQNEECLINIIKDFSISARSPWHLVDEVYIPINYSDEFHWELAIVVLKERRIRVYDTMSRRRRSRPSSEKQKLAKILPTYLDISGFLDQNIHTNLSTIEAYKDKMDNPFDVEYLEGSAQQSSGSV
ncbi:hypothetical protein BC332_03427 [Capsicum chinense]|nr:hypothetical protein BC332_03427 [Capsicum chinense]